LENTVKNFLAFLGSNITSWQTVFQASFKKQE